MRDKKGLVVAMCAAGLGKPSVLAGEKRRSEDNEIHLLRNRASRVIARVEPAHGWHV
jgi:hypothetical protein